jgi:tripartite-type tricarboxylate transporter receptor subunit TctC
LRAGRPGVATGDEGGTRLPRRTVLAAGLAAALLTLRGARAAYPEGPVTWIVPYAAGGGSDIVARLLGEAMAPLLGQPVVIENHPGGGTSLGAAAAARAAPDGRTVLTADNGTLVFGLALSRKLPYDPDRDFQPVGLTVRVPLVLAVTRSSPLTSARELVERARAAPGEISCASAGVGSPHHLAMERLAQATGVRFNHVPYKGAAPALTDLAAGHVEAMMIDYPAAAGHLRAGSIRPLVACASAPLSSLPGVPTVQEALGVAGFEAYAWQGLVVPRATPEPLVERLAAVLAATLRQEPVLARIRELGFEPLSGGPADMRRLTEAERAGWVPLIRTLGLTLD